MMTGVGASGFPIKGTIVPSVPALPCVFITNDFEKYESMKANDEYRLDCVFWHVDEPLYPPFYDNRRFIEVR